MSSFRESIISLSLSLSLSLHFPDLPVPVFSSFPPIINGWHSRIKPETKNTFIERAATDLTKAKITLNMIVTAFSQQCRTPNTYCIDSSKILSPLTRYVDEFAAWRPWR
jgi:hypothetical protein